MSREFTDQEQFEAFIATPEGRSLYESFGVKNYQDYLRVQSEMEMRAKLAGVEKFEPVTEPAFDEDEWMATALKRSAAVEEELRSSDFRRG